MALVVPIVVSWRLVAMPCLGPALPSAPRTSSLPGLFALRDRPATRRAAPPAEVH